MTTDALSAPIEVERPTIAVIICAYTEDRWDDLIAAVEAMVRQRQVPEEVLVVVDHNPGLETRLTSRLGRRTGVRVIPNVGPQGLSGARNTGVDASRSDVVAFVDDDAVAEPSWLDELCTLYSNPSVLGVGGTSEPAWDGGRPAWFPSEFDWVVGCTYRGMPDRTAAVRNMIGSNMSFRRSVVIEAGGFDPGLGRSDGSVLPHGAEETELCIRAAEEHEDGCFVFVPEARVRHRVPVERSTLGYFIRRCWAEGISKALASRKVGSAALATEREYVLRALPRGLARGVSDSVRGRSSDGIRRSTAIGVGLAATAGGYLRGRLADSGRRRG